MDPELRWRLDAITSLLLLIAVVLTSIAIALGGLFVLVVLFVAGLLLGAFLQGLGYTPFPRRYE